jgi:hypothetical protein
MFKFEFIQILKFYFKKMDIRNVQDLKIKFAENYFGF